MTGCSPATTNGKPLALDKPPAASPMRRDRHLTRAWSASVQAARWPQGRPVFQLIAERYLDAEYAPDAVAATCGIPAETIRRIAREIAQAAFEQQITLDDAVDRLRPAGVTRRPSAGRSRCMRCAASRPTPTASRPAGCCICCRSLLGSIDCPGGFRYKAPFPRHAAAGRKPAGKGRPSAGPAAGGHAARLSAGAGGSAGRRRRQAAAHRQGVSRGTRRWPRTA